jgi:hypothetical protein
MDNVMVGILRVLLPLACHSLLVFGGWVGVLCVGFDPVSVGLTLIYIAVFTRSLWSLDFFFFKLKKEENEEQNVYQTSRYACDSLCH